MNWSASVLSAVSSDTEPTVVVTFDNAKYIFNAGENTGRTWLQSRRHWRKARGLFLTSVGTQRASGLPGLTMFLADAGIPSIDIVGPHGLLHYLASMRFFLFRDGLAVNPTEVASMSEAPIPAEPTPVYKDDNVTVYAIPLYPESESHRPSATSASDPDADANLAEGSKRKRSPSPASSSKRPERTFQSSINAEGKSAGSSSPRAEPMSAPEPTFLQRIRQNQFVPASLRGAESQKWRRLVVGNMFPYQPPPPLPKVPKAPQQKKDKKQKKVQDAGTSVVPSPQQPPLPPPRVQSTLRYNDAQRNRERRLPPFSYALDDMDTHSAPTRKPTLSYVVFGPRVRGKFDAGKADALGLAPGPLRGRLIKGETVTFMAQDGDGNTVERTVRPEDCVGPEENSQIMMLLDVPTPAYIPSLLASFSESSFFARLHSKVDGDREEFPVHVIFHLCGEGVLEDERYRAFMNGFSDATEHVVSSREHSADPATFTSAAFTQLRLNKIDSGIFPLLKFRTTASRDLASIPDLPPKTTLLRTNQLIDIRPPRAPVHDDLAQKSDHFHPAMASPAAFSLPPPIAQSVARVREQVTHASTRPSRPGDDVVVVPLGTSSALPTKYRNVSSTLVQIPGRGNVLLDAGEGTWGQLVRMFGRDDPAGGVWDVLRDLKCVFLSHMHGDHHIGLAKILAMRKLLDPPPAQPLYVVGLRHLLVYLREQSELEDLGLGSAEQNGVVTILSDVLNWRNARPYPAQILPDAEPFMDAHASWQSAMDMCSALGLNAFTTVDVSHGGRAYGVVLKHQDGWSLVFSGDTMPTHNLVRVGQNATLLIHEATMGDEEEQMAAAKAHSTFGQAVDIGRRMNARNILLTHFSARYPRMPPDAGAPDPSARSPTVAIAFDHARLRIGDMWKLNTYLPAIERTFADTAEEDDDERTTSASW
ncbi:hypothetical protein B0H21DRAFT_572283 [Amylocystis lapponica]|nr:hypothetical protein B0H21DRAFT_572283 [Amylocystis lapponica]